MLIFALVYSTMRKVKLLNIGKLSIFFGHDKNHWVRVLVANFDCAAFDEKHFSTFNNKKYADVQYEYSPNVLDSP